jgi:RimJ/RimL family protein N-acetyltransferase
VSVRLNAFGQPIGEPVRDWTPPPPVARSHAARMKGRFCHLEPLESSRHAADLFGANSRDGDGRMWTYMPYGPFDTQPAYAAWVDAVASENDPLFFAIVDESSGRATGVASFLRIDPPAGAIEVGHIAYSPLLQRTPAATETMFLMMRLAFELGYRRYEWKCDALNAGSRRAAQRLGLSYEGIFRQARVYKNRNRDTAWFAAIDKEWPRLERAFEHWLAPANFDAEGRQRVSLRELTRSILVKTEPQSQMAADAD